MTLAAACALTVAAETGFFLLLGYRDRMFAAACVCANVAPICRLTCCCGV